MRPSPRLLLFAVLLTGVAAQTSAQTPNEDAKKWTVTGRVLNSATRAPITRAAVTASPAPTDTGPGKPVITESSDGGAFTLSGAQPAEFTLTASRNNYLSGVYGASRPNRPGIPIRLEPGMEVKDIEILLTPPATISGRVLDEHGEPMSGVGVAVQSRRYQSGRREWIYAGGTATNDRGEFRVFGLAPGNYIVAAMLTGPGYQQSGHQNTAYPTLLFPNAADLDEAQILELFPGTDLSGIDFFMKKTPVFRARGRVQLSPGFASSSLGHLQLSSRSKRMEGIYPYSKDGKFEIPNLHPGAYRITSAFAGEDSQFSVKGAFEIIDTDVEGIVLTPVPLVTLTGRLAFDKPGTKHQFESILAVQCGLDDRPDSGSSTQVSAEGPFTLKGIETGATCTLHLHNFIGPSYLKSATLDGESILNKEFQLTGPGTLSITVGFDAASIAGAVTRDGKPAPGATVLLLANTTHPSPFYGCFTLSADNTGQYSISGVQPGEYRLLAVEDIEPGRCQEQGFLEAHGRKGAPVTVAPNGSHTLNLELIQLPN